MKIRLRQEAKVSFSVTDFLQRTGISATTARRVLSGEVNVGVNVVEQWLYVDQVFGPDPDRVIELL